MRLFDILRLALPSLKAETCKIHLAVCNGNEDPLELFLAGRFPEWQRWQNSKNFERAYIVSLIKLEGRNRWLFAGVHSTDGYETGRAGVAFYYHTEELKETESLSGRVVVSFERPGRQSYLNAENWEDRMTVSELLPGRLTVEAFPGFTSVLVSMAKLALIVSQQLESWKSALSSVAGVYLITDTKTGRHYVGSAYGAGGIWVRWTQYVETGHGHNRELRLLLDREGAEYSDRFQFAILETADSNASTDEVLARETHWKDALCSRQSHGGYNAN